MASMILMVGSVFSQINEFSVLFDSGTNAILKNPANLVNSSNYEISIAPIANSHLEITLPFSVSSMFLKENELKNILDLPTLSKKAKSINTVYLASNLTLFYLSADWEKFHWNFYIGDRIISSIGFQYSLFDFLNSGNKPFIGKNIEFSIPLNEIHYRQYSISIAKTVNRKLDIGITGSIYFGKSRMKVLPNIVLFTQNELDYIEFAVKGKGGVSMPIDFIENNDGYVSEFNSKFNLGNYLFGLKNPGMGVDIGVNYKYNRQISLSASATDVGFIYWNKNNNILNLNGAYKWNGIDVSGIIDFNNLDTFVEEITSLGFQDSFINRLIQYEEESKISFTPLNLNFGVSYNYSKKITLALQNQLQFYSPFIRETFSATGSYLVNDKWILMTGLSFKNNSYFNVPAGFAFKNRNLKATFGVSNLWGFLNPNLSKNFGGGFNISYCFKAKTPIMYKQDIHYPFYRRIENNIESKRFY